MAAAPSHSFLEADASGPGAAVACSLGSPNSHPHPAAANPGPASGPAGLEKESRGPGGAVCGRRVGGRARLGRRGPSICEGSVQSVRRGVRRAGTAAGLLSASQCLKTKDFRFCLTFHFIHMCT